MSNAAPHYLLLSETQTDPDHLAGRWRFVLEELDGTGRIEAADVEPGVRGERLQLLAVVRGLEALEQPSRVKLITPSRYVGRGIRNSLATWRENDWHWERFGEMTPIKNSDLWRRVDRASRFHQIDCRVWNFGRVLGQAAARSANQFTHRFSDWAIGPSRRSEAAPAVNRVYPVLYDQAYGYA